MMLERKSVPSRASMAKDAQVTSVVRAIGILELLDQAQRSLNISEIGRRVGIPKSTAHVIVRTLEKLGYVARNPVDRHYTLSLKASVLGRETFRQFTLPDTALPHMRWLANATMLTVHLAVLEKGQGIYVQKVEGPGFIRFDTFVGKRLNLHCTAVGKVLLAYAPDFVKTKILSRRTFARYTKKSIVSAWHLRKALDRVVQEGYALDDQEEELEVRCIAVPVFDHSGHCVAALGMTGTTNQISLSRVSELSALARRAAEAIQDGTG